MKKFFLIIFITIISFADIRTDLFKSLAFINKQIETIDASYNFDLTYHKYNNTLFYKYKKSGSNNKNVLVFAHGGAFIVTSIFNQYFYLTEYLIDNTESGFDVLIIDLKGTKYPEQNKEVNDVVEYALSKYEKVILMGDSSGGNLILSNTIKRIDENKKQVNALVALSPWSDLTNTVNSRFSRRAKDIFLSGEELPELMVNNPYTKGENTSNPYISPKNFPKTLIQVGENEVLYDDSYMVYKKMLKSNVDVRFEEYEGMYHVFQLLSIFNKTKEARNNICLFLDEVYNDKRTENK